MSVSKYAVGFRKQNSAEENADDDGNNPFVTFMTPDSHTI